VGVCVGVCVTVAVTVGVGVGVTVGVCVGVTVGVTVGVDVGVGVIVGVSVGVVVSVDVTVDVGVTVGVCVGVSVGVDVGVGVGPGFPSRQVTLQTSRPTESSSSMTVCAYTSQRIEPLTSWRMRRSARRSCAVSWRRGSNPSVRTAPWTVPAPPKLMAKRSRKAHPFLRVTGMATGRRGFVMTLSSLCHPITSIR
jgi:hypothetical protein